MAKKFNFVAFEDVRGRFGSEFRKSRDSHQLRAIRTVEIKRLHTVIPARSAGLRAGFLAMTTSTKSGLTES